MAAEVNSDWSTNSTEAFNIELVTPVNAGAAKPLHQFKPRFTHPFFGDEESIFGYKGLEIKLRYNACDMRPNLQVKHDKKFKPVNDTVAQDVIPELEQYLPKVAFNKGTTFDEYIRDGHMYGSKWRPPGKKMASFTEGEGKGKSTFEIWRGSLGDPMVELYLKRIQILVPMFIDGGSAIDLEEKYARRWSVFLLFQVLSEHRKGNSPYVFMGYSTVYRYYTIQGALHSNQPAGRKKEILGNTEKGEPLFQPVKALSCRARISQFIILPPFQRMGHGSRLYSTIYQHYLKCGNIWEITVEDPNEEFDILRDRNDLIYLRTRPDFQKLAINPDVKLTRNGVFPTSKVIDTEALETVRLKYKIAPRQFARVVEMYLLSKIPPHLRQSRILVPGEKAKEGKALEEEAKMRHVYHLWQLLVKTRIYRHNKIALSQVGKGERADHVDGAAASVEEGYAELLLAVEGKGVESSVEQSGPKEETSQDEGDGASISKEANSPAVKSEASNDENGKRSAESEGGPPPKRVKTSNNGTPSSKPSGDVNMHAAES